MLSRGFSLFEMLIALSITTMIINSIMTFYPQFHTVVMRIYLQNMLQEVTEQALSGLIKDIHRAGFIANSPNLINKPAIDINSAGNCIILRYDLMSRGEWRNQPNDPQHSDVFTYRYNKHSLEYQTGINHCRNTATRWEKLFDPNEVNVKHFQLKQFSNYSQITIKVELKHDPRIQYQVIHYVKNYNQ